MSRDFDWREQTLELLKKLWNKHSGHKTKIRKLKTKLVLTIKLIGDFADTKPNVNI